MLLPNPTYNPESVGLQVIVLMPEYLKLNANQKKFVTHYIDGAVMNGVYDGKAAILHAYGSETKNADLRAYQILRNRNVKKVLDLHFRKSELDSLLSDIQRAAKKSQKAGGLTPATVRALKAFAKYVAKEKS